MTALSTHHFSSQAALERALAERLRGALGSRGATAIMLSGGNTPLPAYRALGSEALTHDDRLHILFSDERYVASDSEASNCHRARPLLDALSLPPQQVLRVRTELPLEQAAQEYEDALGTLLAAGIPIGLGLLGLGADGHTASLFSAADLTRAAGHLAIPVQRPDGMSGVSVTPDLLAQVHELLFVVAGADKQRALQALERGDRDLIAWRAVQGAARCELWMTPGG